MTIEARRAVTAEAIAWLRRPQAIRARCAAVLAAAEDDALAHFTFDPGRLPAVAHGVAAEIRRNYPDLAVPYHSRWRHFAVGGHDRWAALAERLPGAPSAERARARIDLVVTSVLLDAGAGAAWRYHEAATGETWHRSEGLAVASLALFAAGAFSSDPAQPLRADAAALEGFSTERLAEAFQVSAANPLVGVPGRAELLRRLGGALRGAPRLFGLRPPRVGALYDHLAGRARTGQLAASEILEAVLTGLGSIWPGRIVLDGVNLGDVWRHPAARAPGPTDRLVPFHKLSQWLAYSLLEPLEEAGIEVTGLDELTGLAEYRNGGLLIDLGVLAPRRREALQEIHAVGDEIVVEWRALTVALLDRLAELVRDELGIDAAAFPLAKVLEGGTWSAGRRIARELRPDGAPPLRVASDGTVF